jgi:nucleoside-triphosphatase
MGKKVLLTGPPGCGKTTMLLQVLEATSWEAGGFFTQEERQRGQRVGFRLITLDGRQGMLAHVGRRGKPRVGKYGVDLGVLDSLGAAAIEDAVSTAELVVIDEIGPMELLSARFRQAVLNALESERAVLGTILWRSRPFTDSVKARADVRLIEIKRGERSRITALQIIELLRE